MLSLSLLMILLVVWVSLTVVLLALVIHRSILGFREDNQLFLDRAEAAFEQEQIEVVRRINRLDPIIKGFALGSGSPAVAHRGYLGLSRAHHDPLRRRPEYRDFFAGGLSEQPQ